MAVWQAVGPRNHVGSCELNPCFAASIRGWLAVRAARPGPRNQSFNSLGVGARDAMSAESRLSVGKQVHICELRSQPAQFVVDYLRQ